jgi:hypothetical protein
MSATVVDEERATCSTQGAWSITSVWVVIPDGRTRVEIGWRFARLAQVCSLEGVKGGKRVVECKLLAADDCVCVSRSAS